MTNSYCYRITVEKLTDAKGEPVEEQTLTFEAANHDDVLAIVERMRSRLPIRELKLHKPAETPAS